MRERRNYLLLLGAIAVALVGAVMLAVPGSPIHRPLVKGLDLQGGLEVVLKAVPLRGQQITPAQMQVAQQIMVQRSNGTGVASPSVALQGSDEIVIQLAGIHDPAKAAAIIGSTGQLQFFDFEKDLAPPTVNGGNPTPYPTLYGLLTQIQGQVKKAGAPSFYYLFEKKTTTTKVKGRKKPTTTTVEKQLQGAPTKQELLGAYKGHQQPPHTQILAVPGNREVVEGQVTTQATRPVGTSPNGKYWYLFKYTPKAPNGPPELTGNDLNESGIMADYSQVDNSPEVVLAFTGHGSKEFQRITQLEYQRGAQVAGFHNSAGQANQLYWQHNAIVLDGKLRSTPYIDYTNTQLADGIAGGATISNMGSIDAANRLALVLQSGSLPYTFKTLEETNVTATLGKSSFHQAIWAAIIGLAVVAAFLLLLYRFLGLVAVFGLAIYAVLYSAAILLFNVTLTLPGFAGLILTIGVAADANVVVFERIKEEVRSGKSVRAAISAGYGKGFHTILDANVVTVITAMIIYLIAVADVKGFALMLLIGTVISLLTAVAATRAMLGLLSGFRWFDNPRFMGAHGQQTAKWLQIDFMRRRYLWFAVSGVIIVAGMVSLGVRGLNLGIDFKGGTQVTFNTQQAYPTSKVAAFMSQEGQPDAVVQGTGKLVHGNSNKSWQIRSKPFSKGGLPKFEQSLKSQLGASNLNVKSVSGTFGHQIATDAIYGIIVSLLLITLYITIRFDLKFAIPVILAMLHDIAVTIGFYAIVGKEVSVATVAAVLTVLGYSIYDTIIIFDRIRENMPLMRRSPFATIANISLWETIRRSLATTFITLLPIICLEILGGATLKDFAFALIVGVTSGAYSSIFVAAPLLTIWKEREPDYARRKAAAAPAGDEDGRGDAALAASEAALAAESTPELVDAVTATPSEPGAQARREKRRQRRRSRPHGRAR
ncbi:MAG: protein translocase subunit SecD [Gaiellaceae bacterium]